MNCSEVFPLRLKQIREEMNKTQKEFSDLIGVRQQSLSGYENGKVYPPLDVIINISKKCSVSIDWICGQSDNKRISDQVITYTDLFRVFVTADEGTLFEIGREANPFDKSLLYVTWNDSVIQEFLEDWNKIKRLYHEGTINKELYDLWVKDRLEQKKYSKDIRNLPFRNT